MYILFCGTNQTVLHNEIKKLAFEVPFEVKKLPIFVDARHNCMIPNVKACVRYFSLFLKEKCISSLFRTKYIEKKFNLQLFFLPIVS